MVLKNHHQCCFDQTKWWCLKTKIGGGQYETWIQNGPVTIKYRVLTEAARIPFTSGQFLCCFSV
jgi:hypothetical protein